MRYSVPDNWALSTFENLLTFVLGGDWGKDINFDDPGYEQALCIRASELRNWEVEKGESAALRKVKKTSLEKRELYKGDILVEISGGGPDQPVGRTVLIDQVVISKNSSIKKICTNFFRLTRPSKEIDSNYLNHYLQHFYKSGNIKDYQAGSNNLRNLKFNDYLQLEIPVASFGEQKRIVAKIEELFSELDNGIAALKTAREQLKVYRQSVLKHAFEGKLTAKWREENADKLESPEQLLARIQQEREASYAKQLEEWKAAVTEWESNGKEGKKPGKPKPKSKAELLSKSEVQRLPDIPKNWAFLGLGNFIESIDAGKSFKCDERQPSESEIGVAKVSAVTWGKYDESESKTCTDPSRVNSNYFVKKGDFILSRANTIELVGACVIVHDVTKNIMLSDKTLRINFHAVNELYILYYLRSYHGRNEIMGRSTGNQDSMRNIGQDRVKNIVVPICSREEMKVLIRKISKKLDYISRFSQKVETQIVRSETLRQSILKKAFSGQLVPQDPNDEPASELLARIQAEKEKRLTSSKTKAGSKRARKSRAAGK